MFLRLIEQYWWCAAVAVVFLLVLRLANSRPVPEKDPRRLFTTSQKKRGGSRAGGRCEMEYVPFVRCRRAGEHGDHWWPHTAGGATTLGNYVHACAKHNLRKSSSRPSRWQTGRLERRRRSYFPRGESTLIGERFRP